MVLVLITGLSGTGKSTVIAELRARGHDAYEADEGFSERRQDGECGWNVDKVAELFRGHVSPAPLFFAGCSEEQLLFTFDHKVLLTTPRAVMAHRLKMRSGNDYGKTADELMSALDYVDTVEPLLRASCDAIIDTATTSPSVVADKVLDLVVGASRGTSGGG